MTDNPQNLSLRQKIGQLFIIGIAGPELDAETRSLVNDVLPGGICLFSRNVRDASQTRELLDALRSEIPFSPILSLDQEGGTVDRLRRVVTPMYPANKIRTKAEAAEMAALIAETIGMLGFNMDFAPVVDVVGEGRAGSSNGLFSRPFGRSKEEVVEFAGEFLRVLQENGSVGCLKHFPGLGGAKVDAHEELPAVNISRDELFDVDLYPYRELFARGGVNAVMVAHASFPAIDLQETGRDGKLLPSSLSFNFITTLLRGELGFDGLVITDDMEMGAILRNYGIGEACVMALEAGVDMLAICADPANIRSGLQAVSDAVDSGRITEGRIDESFSSIAKLKAGLIDPPTFDAHRIGELSARIDAFNSSLDQV